MVPDRAENGSPVALAVIGVVCAALFASLFVRLYYLQVIDHQTFEVESKAVHFRIKHEEGPRGRILDRNGKILVDNKIVDVIGIDKEVARSKGLGDGAASDTDKEKLKRTKVFRRLAVLLTGAKIPTKVTTIETLYTDVRYGPNDFIPIVDKGVTEELKAYLGERHDDFPGIVAKARTVRVYPYGSLAAHILGYVGQIIPDELARPDVKAEGTPAKPARADAKPYALDDQIGKAGVERTFEKYLRGTPGDTVIQVDARGRSLGVAKEPKLEQGDDVWLTIDIDQQALTEQRLAAQVAARHPGASDCKPACNAQDGAAVLLDPSNGQVLSMASYPTYDPSELVNGISTETWNRLNSKENHKPMLNRAINEVYAPGSTFKLVTTLAGLKTGVLNPQEVYQDKGIYKLDGCTSGKCQFQNAGAEKLGAVNLESAITRSSDTYFFRIGDVLWRRRGEFGDTPIQDAAKLFGFAQKTGIALPSESAGVVATPEWLKQAKAQHPNDFARGTWTIGDNLNTALGQGMVAVTPLQLANAYATFANGGTRYVPQIALRVTRPKSLAKAVGDLTNVELVQTFDPQVSGQVTFPTPEDYAIVYRGFQGVPIRGTAQQAFDATPVDFAVAGKTGTAQVSHRADTSLFVGWGPATGFDVPRYAMASIIPEGGFGAYGSAPVVFGVLQAISRSAVPVITPAPAAPERSGTPVPTTTTTTTTPIEIATSDPSATSTTLAPPPSDSVTPSTSSPTPPAGGG